MKRPSASRYGKTRPAIVMTVVSVIIVLSIASVVIYQRLPMDRTSDSGSLSGGSSANTVSSTSSSSTTSSESSAETTFTTTSEHVFIPCNCSIDLSWAWSIYNTLSSLTSTSHYVVVANVTSELTVGVNVSADDGPGVKGLVPVTGYNITVASVISDPFPGKPGLQPGDRLTVVQIGGTKSGMTMSVVGYPSLFVGESYVLFLTTYESLLPHFYGSINDGFTLITTGGPQGLFYIQGGNVYSLNNMYPQADAWLPVTANGVPLTQFVSEVQSISASTISSSSTTYDSSIASNSTAITSNP
jgi:hypothetical protein